MNITRIEFGEHNVVSAIQFEGASPLDVVKFVAEWGLNPGHWKGMIALVPGKDYEFSHLKDKSPREIADIILKAHGL